MLDVLENFKSPQLPVSISDHCVVIVVQLGAGAGDGLGRIKLVAERAALIAPSLSIEAFIIAIVMPA